MCCVSTGRSSIEEPDFAGASYWINEYNGLRSPQMPHQDVLDEFAWAFKESAEFRTQFGGAQSNDEFLTIVYSNVLGRTPDRAGFDYWLGEMNGGLSQHAVVRWVAANDEFKARYPYRRIYPQVSGTIFEVMGGASYGCNRSTSVSWWSVPLRTHDLPGEITASDPSFTMASTPMPDGSTRVDARFEYRIGATANQMVTLRSGDLTIVLPANTTVPLRVSC
ncbi:MAG: DUF4214 domain-containing protein [Acidimicrobiales bacterium]